MKYSEMDKKKHFESGNVPCSPLGYRDVQLFYGCGNYIKITNKLFFILEIAINYGMNWSCYFIIPKTS